MTVLRVDPLAPDPAIIDRAAAALRRGALVAFPTETVYGLGANALDAAAAGRIFEAKGRPAYNPLIVHVANAEAASALVREWPEAAARLGARFWPGPLTLVLPRRPIVPDVVTAGLDTVAIRVPSHPVARALLEAAGVPVAAPSANRFTELSPTRAEHVARALGDRVAMVLDGGPTTVGIESTVVDLSGARPVLLRPGMISASELEPITGPLDRPAPTGEHAPRPAPGMTPRHYAPRAALRVFGAAEREAAVAVARAEQARGGVVGALLRTPLEAPIDHPVPMPHDAAGYARELYGALHALDDAGCSLVLVEAVPDAPDWAGVRDRLARGSRRPA